MSRLPVVAGDVDQWGPILNDFLLVAHNADGTLKEIVKNPQSSSYTLVASDKGKAIDTTSGSANTVTIPSNASAPMAIGTLIEIAQYGAGQTTIAAAAGVTIRSAGGKMKLASQYSVCSLRKINTDEWWLAGDLIV